MFETLMDVLSLCCLIGAGGFSVAAGVGLLRFPDALSRLHAATKPQIFGLLLVIAAIALRDHSWMTLLALLPGQLVGLRRHRGEPTAIRGLSRTAERGARRAGRRSGP